MAIGGLSPAFLSGIGAAVVGLIFHIIGVTTPGWSSYEAADTKHQVGLFETCGCRDLPEKFEPDELDAVRAMVIIGMIIAIAGIALISVYAFCVACGKSFFSKAYIITALACIVAFIFILIGVIIYGTEIHDDKYPSAYDLGYSFALCIVGGIMMVIGGVLLFMAGRKMS